jgi:hypothetical protein
MRIKTEYRVKGVLQRQIIEDGYVLYRRFFAFLDTQGNVSQVLPKPIWQIKQPWEDEFSYVDSEKMEKVLRENIKDV